MRKTAMRLIRDRSLRTRSTICTRGHNSMLDWYKHRFWRLSSSACFIVALCLSYTPCASCTWFLCTGTASSCSSNTARKVSSSTRTSWWTLSNCSKLLFSFILWWLQLCSTVQPCLRVRTFLGWTSATRRRFRLQCQAQRVKQAKHWKHNQLIWSCTPFLWLSVASSTESTW